MSANLPSFEIANLRHPTQGARCIQASFLFGGGINSIAGDFMLEVLDGHIDFIQSVFVDNSINPDGFTLVIPGVGSKGYRITVPPNTQAMLPIVAPTGTLHYIASSLGQVEVDCTFFNIPMPYFQASSIAPPNPTPTVITGTNTNHSGVIAAANVSQVIIPANANRLRAVVQNPSANVGSIWIQFAVAATEDEFSQEILPGQEFDSASGPLSLDQISIIGATGGATFYANELHL